VPSDANPPAGYPLADTCYYDPTLFEIFSLFCKKYLIWPHGHRAGQPVVWDDWQNERLWKPIYGIRNKETGLLEVSTAFMLSARGQGKTAAAAAIGLFDLCVGTEHEPEVDLFAVSRVQAGRMWEFIESFVRRSPELSRTLVVLNASKTIVNHSNHGKLVVRSGDASSEYGLNPSLALLDELLSQKNRELYDAINTAVGKRPHSLFAMFTTPAPTPDSFAVQEYIYAKEAAKDPTVTPSYLSVIYESDAKDDIHDRKTWLKSAPALGTGAMSWSVYEKEAARAKNDTLAEHSFRVFRLAQWPEASSNYINITSWDACAERVPALSWLKRYPCYFGLDMSGSRDFTSLCMHWAFPDGGGWMLWKHWCTQESYEVTNKLTQGLLGLWRRDPSVSLTVVPAKLLPTELIAEEVIVQSEEMEPLQIGIDSFRAKEMMSLLEEHNVAKLSSTGRSMHAATERLSGMAHSGALKHNGDKLARWMLSNVSVMYDSQGYPKIVKGRDRLAEKTPGAMRIDGIAAACMAVDRRIAIEAEEMEKKGEVRWYFGDEELAG